MGSMLFVAVFIALQCATGLANPEAKRLYDDLLSNYNRLIRPVGNNSDRLTVKMGLRLSQLIDVVSIMCAKDGAYTTNFACSSLVGRHSLYPYVVSSISFEPSPTACVRIGVHYAEIHYNHPEWMVINLMKPWPVSSALTLTLHCDRAPLKRQNKSCII